MILKIKDLKNGKIYTNDMSDQNPQSILSINFCTSYTQVEVQDEIDKKFITHTIILPPYGVSPSSVNWVDLIAIQDDSQGEWAIDVSDKPKCGNPNPPCSGVDKFGVYTCRCDWSEI